MIIILIIKLKIYRKLPKLSFTDIIRLVPAGVMSAGAHAASVFSLAAGGVAFGQVSKILLQISSFSRNLFKCTIRLLSPRNQFFLPSLELSSIKRKNHWQNGYV